MAKALSVAVIGLGSMGYGIAQSCLRAGHQTFGYDVAEAPMVRFRAEGGAEGELSVVAGTVDALVVVVLNAAQTEDVLFGVAAALIAYSFMPKKPSLKFSDEINSAIFLKEKTILI